MMTVKKVSGMTDALEGLVYLHALIPRAVYLCDFRPSDTFLYKPRHSVEASRVTAKPTLSKQLEDTLKQTFANTLENQKDRAFAVLHYRV